MLDAKIKSLETELSSVEEELNNNISDEITGLKTDLTTVISSVKEELLVDINALKEEIKSLKDKDTELNNKITSLNDTLTNLINNNKSWVESNYATIASCNQLEKDIKALITSIDTKVKALETSITSIGEQIKTINTTLGEMKTLDVELKGKITALETKATSIEVELLDINESINTLDSTHSTKLNELKTSLESELANIKTDIISLKAKDIELNNKVLQLEQALTENVIDLSEWVANNYATIDLCETLEDEINDLISELDTRVSSLETSLSTLTTSLEVLEEKVNEHETEINILVDRVNCLYGIHKGSLQVRYIYDDSYENATAEQYYDCCDIVNLEEKATLTYSNGIIEYSFGNDIFENKSVDLTDCTNTTPEDLQNRVKKLMKYESSNISLTLNDNSGIEMYKAIAEATSSDSNINLTINGVQNIPDSAFCDFAYIISINLPDTIYIGNLAFDSCEMLETVIAPKVKVVGESAFSWTKISTLRMPLVEEIKSYAFTSCYKLTEIDLPSLKIIEKNAFENNSLTTANIPNVTTIGNRAFGYNNFIEINLPNVTSIGDKAFYGNTELRKVTIGQPLVYVGKEIFYSIGPYVVDTAEIDLVLRSGQKDFTGSLIEGWILSENDLPSGGNTFIGYTFNSIEIIPYSPTLSELEITGCEEEYIYTGTRFTPEISIVYQERLLVKDVDYTLEYGENLYVGEASIIIIFKGNYTNTVTYNFQIIQDPATDSFDGEWVTF